MTVTDFSISDAQMKEPMVQQNIRFVPYGTLGMLKKFQGESLIVRATIAHARHIAHARNPNACREPMDLTSGFTVTASAICGIRNVPPIVQSASWVRDI